MTKQIEDYTADELSAKIQAIKAERERTANALKRYEEELERRKQEAPLGVPLKDTSLAHHYSEYIFGFTSEESSRVFDGRLKDYIEALQKLAKGEPIDIQALLPLLKKGYIAMDADGEWFWYKCKPFKEISFWDSREGMFEKVSFPINLKSVDSWKDSLMECGI